jgi:glycosyltransferase involved in cell wall biosynthesis
VLTAVRAANTAARVVFNQQTPMSEFLTDADYHWRRHWHKAAFSAVTRIGYGAVDLVIATSRGVARDLTRSFGVDPDRIAVLPNPVDLDRVRAAANEPIDAPWSAPATGPLLVAAGRLADAKNYPLLIDAFAIVSRQLPARLWILGQGEREGALRQRIADRGLTNVVTLLGFQPNPWKFIARADAFVLTSRYEGFGNVLIEAMACGVPVVATASPGTIDIVTPDVDGVLVESHDADSVAAAMRRVLDPPTRARLADGARRSAVKFGLPMAIERYDAVLREVLA